MSEITVWVSLSTPNDGRHVYHYDRECYLRGKPYRVPTPLSFVKEIGLRGCSKCAQ